MSDAQNESEKTQVMNAADLPPAPRAALPPDDGAASRAAEREIRRLSRRSFLWGAGAAATLGFGIYRLNKAVGEDGIPTPLRKTLLFNEGVAQRLFFSPNRNAPEYPRAWAREPRNNYKGETPEIDLEKWRMTLHSGADKKQVLTLADIKALPRVEQTTELKCVEGWSCIVTWAGARFVDFARKYPPPPGTQYVEMRSETEGYPDEAYYIGLDLASCLHPQTLLAWEMNGAPLNSEHGAPLRLAMPHKYGIKNIKLITHIAYRTDRPDDYWAERGYDFYAGL